VLTEFGVDSISLSVLTEFLSVLTESHHTCEDLFQSKKIDFGSGNHDNSFELLKKSKSLALGFFFIIMVSPSP